MEKQNQQTKNGFESKPIEERVAIIKRYVDKYKDGSVDSLIELCAEHGIVGQLIVDPNFRF